MTNWEILSALRNIAYAYVNRGEHYLSDKFHKLADEARERMVRDFNDGRGDT